MPLAVSLAGILDELGLTGLFLLMVGETVFPPIPSEAVLPLAGYLVERGELSLAAVLATSTAGSLTGAMLLYELARRGGRPFALRFGKVARVDEERLERAESWFTRRGPLVVLLARCVPGVRSLVSLPAGLLRMPRLQYVVLTTIGTVLWNAILGGLGWFLGHEWHRVSDAIGSVSTPLLVGAIVVVTALVVWFEWRRHT